MDNRKGRCPAVRALLTGVEPSLTAGGLAGSSLPFSITPTVLAVERFNLLAMSDFKEKRTVSPSSSNCFTGPFSVITMHRWSLVHQSSLTIQSETRLSAFCVTMVTSIADSPLDVEKVNGCPSLFITNRLFCRMKSSRTLPRSFVMTSNQVEERAFESMQIMIFSPFRSLSICSSGPRSWNSADSLMTFMCDPKY